MLHYFTYVLFAVTIQASIVTPALAYPLVSNNTLGNSQEGLVRRTNTQFLSLALVTQYVSKDMKRHATDFRAQHEQCTIGKCIDAGGVAWYPHHATELSHLILLRKNIPHPSQAIDTKGVCLERITRAASLGIYHEVHPCWAAFSLGDTKLYKSKFTTLRYCAETGIAFWPLNRHEVTCGLVWPSMVLIGNQGLTQGTCFMGPKNPTDPTKGLSPCQKDFSRPNSPFYLELSLSLGDCRKMQHAVAWRDLHLVSGCVVLPSNINDISMIDMAGHCYVYEKDKHKDWYLRQALPLTENHWHITYYNLWKQKRSPLSDWVKMRPAFLLSGTQVGTS